MSCDSEDLMEGEKPVSGEEQVTYIQGPVMEFAELVSSIPKIAEHNILVFVKSFVVAIANGNWSLVSRGAEHCLLWLVEILSADSSQDRYFCSPGPLSLIPYEKHFSLVVH